MKHRRVFLGEWLFTITVPARGGRGPIRVIPENFDSRDREFGVAIARVAEVYLNARKRR